MKYCTRCLYPANHPLNITFDEQGVCSGCRVHEEKDQLDWRERLERLRQILKSYKSHKRTIHDCIVPVSGARDSYFIVHVVKNILGLNPLLVAYNKQYNTKRGIRNLAYLRTLLGCDIMSLTVSPDRIKKITLESLRKMGSIYWHCLAGQTVYPVKVAVQLKIPLIIWGVHQGCDQVGMFSHLDEVEMTRKYRKEHDLMGYEAEDLLKDSQYLTRADLEQFFYPNDKELEAVGVRGIYLGNYFRWDSKTQHEEMIKKYHYESALQQRTFDTYNDVDCFHYSGLHDYIKFLKFGYGKVTDHACREIRLKRLSRQDGINLVQKYQNIIPEDIKLFVDWMQIKEDTLWNYINRHRDLRIWKYVNREWILRDSIVNHNDNQQSKKVSIYNGENCQFEITHSKNPEEAEDKYVLVGRGWVD